MPASTGTVERPSAHAFSVALVALTASSVLVWVVVLTVMVVLLSIKRVRFVGFGILTTIFLTPPMVIGVNDGVDTLLRAIGR
jgi:hypothetical protein